MLNLLLLGAGAYMLTKPKTEPAKAGTLTVQQPTELERTIADVLKRNPSLLPKGVAGPQGPQGPQGAAGVTTIAPQNSYGNSLLVNAAGEENTAGWSGATGVTTAGITDYSCTSTYATNNTTFKADPYSLYKLELNLINSSAIMLYAVHPDGTVTTATLVATTSVTKRKVVKYFRVEKYTKIQLAATNGTAYSFDSVILSKVPLGEPVPNNLPFLPAGQLVYDVTTGEVGRYNGTTVNYFAMQP